MRHTEDGADTEAHCPAAPAPRRRARAFAPCSQSAERLIRRPGWSLRLIADRLGIDLDEARAHLRESYADARDRDVLDPEARALANTRQRRTRERRRAEAVG